MNLKTIKNLLSQRRVQLAIIAIVTFLVFSNTLQNKLAIDDDALIVKWQTPHSLTIANIWKLIGGDLPQSLQGSYRPLRSVIYAVYYSLWQENPFFYHLSGLFLHILITVVVYLLLDSLFKNRKLAFIGGLLFGLHPIHTEAVDWIASSMDLIGVVFFFLSFYLFLKAKSEVKNPKNYYLASVFFALLAFLGNELTLTLPILILFYMSFVLRFNFKKIKEEFSLVFPYFFIAVLFLFLRAFIVKGALGAQGFVLFNSFYYTVLFMVKVVAKYIYLFFAPFNLSINHILSPGFETFSTTSNLPSIFLNQSLFDLEEIMGLMTLAIVVILIPLLYKKIPKASFGIIWIFITLSPQLLFHATVFSERYAYIASFGFILILMSLYEFMPKKWDKWRIVGLLFLIVFYGFLTYQRNKDWQNNLTLWSSVIRVYPKSALAYYNLGFYYSWSINGNRYDQSILNYKKVLELRPDSIFTYNELAKLYEKTGDKQNAIKIYEKILSIKPSFAPAINALSLLSPQSSQSGSFGSTRLNGKISYSISPGISFEYPSSFNLIKTKKGVILKNKSSDFTIALEPNPMQEEITVKDYINNQKTSYGTLVNQGLAQIPSVDYAYVKVWKLSNSTQMMQFFLFSSNKVLEIRVSPSNTPLMKTFDEIISSLKLN